MQTCVPHLLSLINVTIAFLFDVLYSRYGSKNVPQGVRNGPGISTHTTHFKSAYLWIKSDNSTSASYSTIFQEKSKNI